MDVYKKYGRQETISHLKFGLLSHLRRRKGHQEYEQPIGEYQLRKMDQS